MQIKCCYIVGDEVCGLIGEARTSEATFKIENTDKTIDYQFMILDACGHKTVYFAIDEKSIEKIANLETLRERAKLLMGSHDHSGFERTLKKIQAVEIDLRDRSDRLCRDVLKEGLPARDGWSWQD